MSLKVLIIGATGGTGQQLVAQALQAGCDVTAFARNISRISVQHERLRCVAGDATAAWSSLDEAMRGQDAAISAIGVGASLQAGDLIQRAVPAMLSAMRAHRVRRLIFTSAIGVGDAFHDAPLFSRIMIRLLLRDIYADKAIGDALVEESGLDWTIVQPAQLTNGPLTGTCRAGENLKWSGIPTISRADVAHFMLGELKQSAYIGKTVRLGY